MKYLAAAAAAAVAVVVVVVVSHFSQGHPPPFRHVIPHTIQMLLLFTAQRGDRLNGLLSVFLMAVPWYYIAQPIDGSGWLVAGCSLGAKVFHF